MTGSDPLPCLPSSVGPTIKQVMCPGIRLAEVKCPGLGLLPHHPTPAPPLRVACRGACASHSRGQEA